MDMRLMVEGSAIDAIGIGTSRDPETDRALLKLVDQFVREVIGPRAAEIDRVNQFPEDVFDGMAKIGLLGTWVPEEFGGLGTSLRTNLLIAERIARVSAACALIFSQCGDGASTLLVGASRRILEEYLPRIATGDIIPCFAMTEAGAGSDAAAIATRAVRTGDSYVISGRKLFCTCGSVGGLYIVFAKTDPEMGSRGVSAFVVPRTASGLTIGRDEDLIGLRGCPASEVILDDVVVPAESLLGDEGAGFRIAMKALDEARLNAAIQALGIGLGALDLAISHVRERKAFGQELIRHQGLQFLMAELTTEAAAAWALLDESISRLEAGRSREATAYAAMAKLFCADFGMRATVEAVQVFGGYGLTKDLPLERMMRDVKAYQIFDGTTQIQKSVIGRYLEQFGKLPFAVD
jgi:acyl-CoA dehydrogenase